MLYWMVLPLCIAIGSSLLAWLLMDARIQVVRARFDAIIASLEQNLEVQKAAYRADLGRQCALARREAFEELLREIKVERRECLRRTRRLFRSAVEVEVQERLSIHRIPLTGWVAAGIFQPPALARTEEEPQPVLGAADAPLLGPPAL
jgi:hypothetical protein